MDYAGRTMSLVAGLHGNERAPVRALTDAALPFVLGNPTAYERDVRFVDQDLNASFGLSGDSYELRRAEEILAQVPAANVVIDFHTTKAKTEPFVILVDPSMLPLAERTGLAIAVLMTHNIKKGHALINARDGISVEMTGHDTQESYDVALSVIRQLESGESKPLTVYEVYDRITEPGDYENFVECAAGFFPVLVGETSYDFIGLKARKLT